MDPYPTNALTGGAPQPRVRDRFLPEDKAEYTRWAFYAGIAGGVLILLAAFVTALFLTAWATFSPGALPTWWADGADPDDSAFPEVPLLIAIWGLITGAAVILAALRAKERPTEGGIPGIIMVSAGLLSFLAMGGFLIGGLAAMIGGVLAIAGGRSLWMTRAPRVRDRDLA